MVTRSVVNYPQHKKDVYNIVLKKLGKKKADIFIKHYSNTYDKWDRSFIDYRLAVQLMKDYYHVKKVGTRLIGVVGPGGAGKSTLLKNILYFLDDSFTNKQVHQDIFKFMKHLKTIPIYKEKSCMRSIMMDEPEIGTSSNSKIGHTLRDIIGTWRKHGVFTGVCATDLIDIPTYLFKKIELLLFVPHHGTCFVVRDIPKKYQFAIQKIRLEYTRGKGYKIFNELYRKKTYGQIKGVYRFKTMKLSPLDFIDHKEYLQEKIDNYKDSIKHFVMTDTRKKSVEISPRDKIILKLRSEGKTQKEVAKLVGVHKNTIHRIENNFKSKEAFSLENPVTKHYPTP